MLAMKDYFGCGHIRRNRNILVYSVTDQTSIQNIIVPFFEKNELCTTKKFDFSKFRKVSQIKEKKEHLTEYGKEKIEKIRSNME